MFLQTQRCLAGPHQCHLPIQCIRHLQGQLQLCPAVDRQRELEDLKLPDGKSQTTWTTPTLQKRLRQMSRFLTRCASGSCGSHTATLTMRSPRATGLIGMNMLLTIAPVFQKSSQNGDNGQEHNAQMVSQRRGILRAIPSSASTS